MTELRVTATEPSDVGEARQAIERSRERISETLGAIEERLVETRDSIRERVDVLRPVKRQVRTRPWMAVAVAAGVGAALGGVLGGGDDHDAESRDRDRDRGPSHRRGRSRYHATDDGDDVRDVERHFASDSPRNREERADYVDVIDAQERRRRRAYRAQRRERLRAERETASAARSRRGSGRSGAGRHDEPDEHQRGATRGGGSIRADVMRAIAGAITDGLRERNR